jgi:hypothetical protein
VQPSQGAPTFDFGCFFSLWSDEDTSYSGWSGLGPIVEHIDGKSYQFDAVRPFFSREVDGRGRLALDYLWPVGSTRIWEDKSDWRFLVFYGHDDNRFDPTSAYYVWCLPFLFFGKNREGDDYGAVFPLGGKIENFMGRDEMSFVLFPLYAHSRLNDLETDHYLWPLISRTTGDGVKVGRFFPFYGYSTKTNIYEKSFVMWPIWSQMRDLRPGKEGKGYMVFPLFGYARRPNEQTWMAVPPLFRYSKTKYGSEGACPWPIVQWSSGPRDRLYIWPFYGSGGTDKDTLTFWLWPIAWKGFTITEKGRRDRFRVFPIYDQQSRRSFSGGVTNLTARYVSVWPVVAYDRQGSNTLVRIPDLWPFLGTPPVKRNLTPLWTLYSRQRSPMGTNGQLLWGLARWKTDYDGDVYRSLFPLVSWQVNQNTNGYREWDALKGLVGYRRDSDAKTIRLLYFLRWRISP